LHAALSRSGRRRSTVLLEVLERPICAPQPNPWLRVLACNPCASHLTRCRPESCAVRFECPPAMKGRTALSPPAYPQEAGPPALDPNRTGTDRAVRARALVIRINIQITNSSHLLCGPLCPVPPCLQLGVCVCVCVCVLVPDTCLCGVGLKPNPREKCECPCSALPRISNYRPLAGMWLHLGRRSRGVHNRRVFI
jgi:hypothetical protein